MRIVRVNKDNNVNTYGLKLLSLCCACDMVIMNGRVGQDKEIGNLTFHSHMGISTNDYVLCDRATLYKVDDFCVGQPNCFSDHCTISINLKVNIIQKVYNSNEEQCRMYAKWEQDRKDEYVSLISSDYVQQRASVLNDMLATNTDSNILEDAIVELTELIVESGSSHLKQVRNGGEKNLGREQSSSKKGGKWYDDECTKQKEVFQQKQRKYLETGDECDRIQMSVERNVYRKLCRKKKRLFDRMEAQRLVGLSKLDPRAFWREIKKNNKSDKGGLECNFFEHFSELAGKETEIGIEGREEIKQGKLSEEKIDVDELDEEITIQELESTIKELRKDKSAGHDNILNEFIVNASPTIKFLILAIFNNILLTEFFPSVWAVGSIVPIFKKGDNKNPNNYRGITVLSCLGKLFTRLMNNRLSKWAESENRITNSQYGFRKGKSTTDCVFILKGLIDMILSQGNKLYAAFVDYEKAYDYLDRTAVFYKLTKNGVSSKFVNIFKSLYSKIKLNLRGYKSEEYFTSNCGLLQGESTSPLLFSFFVNDLENSLQQDDIGCSILDTCIKFLMFADDTVIISKTKDGLQAGLDSLERYCMKWGLRVNANKTKIVVFRKGGKLKSSEKWTYCGKFLEIVSSFKYLGCILSITGSFKKIWMA